LFRRLFYVKPRPKKDASCLVRGAGFQMRQEMRKLYLEYDMHSTNAGWKNLWWYVGNYDPKLPEFTGVAPVDFPEWKSLPTIAENAQVNDLLDKIAKLKEKGVTGASVVFSWIKRRVQPLAQKEGWGFEYKDRDDPTRMTRDELSEVEIMQRVQMLMPGVHCVPFVPQLFDADHPPKQVSS